jgi:signal transduction histidine kinase
MEKSSWVKQARGVFFGSGGDALESKRQAVVMVRWVLVTAASYLMLFSGSSNPHGGVLAVVALLLASNILIGRLPDAIVAHPGFDALVLLVDTVLLSIGFYLSSGVTSDFYLIYFFVIFLAGVSERLSSVLLGSLLAAGAYVSLRWAGLTTPIPDGSMALRVSFIFAVALFYGFLVERIRVDREKRQEEHYARLERVNARLRELVALREAFVGSVSHELRTPLNAMLGYIDLVREGSVGEIKPAAAHYIDKAYGRGVHLLRIIEELLNFASLAKGQLDVEAELTDVRALLERVRGTVEPSARAKGLEFRVDVDPSVDSGLLDAGKFVQILLHLVTNAIKFTDSGKVSVRAAQYESTLSSGWQGQVLEIAVSDSGQGVSAEMHEAIFEEFRQGDLGASRRHEGIGLGLAVCRGLVKLMRGDLTLDSTVGRGSTFTVRLPLSSAQTATQEDSLPLAIAGAAH